MTNMYGRATVNTERLKANRTYESWTSHITKVVRNIRLQTSLMIHRQNMQLIH